MFVDQHGGVQMTLHMTVHRVNGRMRLHNTFKQTHMQLCMSYVWTAPASCTCVYEIVYQRKYFFLKKWVRQRKCVCCIRICRHTFVCIRFCFSKYFFKIICEIHHKLVVSRQPYVYLRLVNIPIRNLICMLVCFEGYLQSCVVWLQWYLQCSNCSFS